MLLIMCINSVAKISALAGWARVCIVHLFASVILFQVLAAFAIFLCYKNVADEHSIFRQFAWRQSTEREALIGVHLILRAVQSSFFVSFVTSIFINVQ